MSTNHSSPVTEPPVQQITKQAFIRLGITAFKEHELREIVEVFCRLPGIAPRPGIHAQRQASLDQIAKDWQHQIISAGADENVAQQAVALAALNGLFDGYCSCGHHKSDQCDQCRALAVSSTVQQPVENKVWPTGTGHTPQDVQLVSLVTRADYCSAGGEAAVTPRRASNEYPKGS